MAGVQGGECLITALALIGPWRQHFVTLFWLSRPSVCVYSVIRYFILMYIFQGWVGIFLTKFQGEGNTLPFQFLPTYQ